MSPVAGLTSWLRRLAPGRGPEPDAWLAGLPAGLDPVAVALLPGENLPGRATVTVDPRKHPSGSPSFALRMTCERKVVCYTGDTEWVDALIPAARGVDLLIAEAYTAERPVRFHLDWATLHQHLPAIAAKSVLLTHMSPDMLGHTPEAGEKAEDGRIVLF